MKTSLLFLIALSFMLGWLFENTLNLRNTCTPPTVRDYMPTLSL